MVLAVTDRPMRSHPDAQVIPDLFAGDGAMAALMRSIDWSVTPLGPTGQWPQNLRMMVRVLLANRFPLLLWWGPDYIQLYNDAYRPVLGTKHPASMGQPARECFPEIWRILGPLIDAPFRGGPATWMEDIFLEVNRHGFVEETHFTVAYSPVPADDPAGGISGVLGTVHEITEKVLGERRLAVLRDVGGRSLAESQTAESACATAAAILEMHSRDVPFALIYLIDRDATEAHLAGAAGVESSAPMSRRVVELDHQASAGTEWPIGDAIRTGAIQTVEKLASRFERVPPGPWTDAPHTAVVVPIPGHTSDRFVGALVAGVSARVALDEVYQSFFVLLAAQIATGIANARAYEAEKRRAEELAELDRAKTAFFSNVSHEFRTPLTLMLGPTADLLANPAAAPADRERLELIHRNTLRLQKLVNSMLDFSRIEAGRAAAAYDATDLAAFTAELASAFRSATDRAGLALVVDAPPLPAPVYVDRDMWEKIVLNLLSNAFKHTFEGEITVRVRDAGAAAVVDVCDTGVGIAADQLPRVFERFHRVPNARSRTHEGTGIGLALVKELVRWHGGHVEVVSRSGEGTTFTITIPYGTAHLPPHGVVNPGRAAAWQQGATRLGVLPYVEEALRLLPQPAPRDSSHGAAGTAIGGVTSLTAATTQPASDAPRILLADDNADMRDYVARLLIERGWFVEAVGDGSAALAAARRRRPDLVLTDVMMPGLDGFALMRALRREPATATVPVVLLSARAGEEARIEGAEAGADDYLVKPFGAQELLARVGAQLTLARERARALQAAQAANRAKSEFLAVMSHELRTPLNAIGGYAELIELEVHGPVTAQQRTALARIKQSQEHLLTLINQVLHYTRAEAGGVQYEAVDVSVSEALAAAEALVVPQVRAKGLAYILSECNPAVCVRADRDKLQQILLNLLSNAIKFTEVGGEIRVTYATRGATIAITVADTGIGIAAEKLATVFLPFVQVDQRLTRRNEGVGLGLAISRDLARGMGGDLTVESTLGAGSAFTLVLPAGGSALSRLS
jgi:signal transduction histidine kinase